MGALASRILKTYSPCARKECKVLICGLDAAGKTSVLYKLKLPGEEVTTVIPTIGFNVETISIDAYEFTAWDVGGRDKIRPLWRHYYRSMQAIIFVVDSSDVERMDAARDEFHRMLNEPELRDVPVLLMCNKQDIPNALSPEIISGLFGVSDYENSTNRRHQVTVQGCSVLKNSGVLDGLKKLAEVLESPPVMPDNRATEIPTTGFSNMSDFQQASTNATLERFDRIKLSTQCPFAKAAKLWGGKTFAGGPSIEDQAETHAKDLTEFTLRSSQGEKLDGFCIDIDDELATTRGPVEFGECVRRMLTALSELDPSGENAMKVNYIGERGWRFRFNRTDFFVTTFAPCYPTASSRYTFGSDHAFILLQPEASFLRHNLPPDSSETHWDHPKTIRDKTRIAFRDAGRPYFTPGSTAYPVAEHIVKPVVDDGVSVVHWWIEEDNEYVVVPP